MSRYCSLLIIFLLLSGSCIFAFRRLHFRRQLREWYRKTRELVENRSGMRLLERRKAYLELREKSTLLDWIEQQLEYCGFRRRHPNWKTEYFLAVVLAAGAGCFVLCTAVFGVEMGAAALGVFFLSVILYVEIGKKKAGASVNNNLIKFLDFLGNYSITSGELTSIFRQVSRYMEEPLKSVLEECEAESRISGDVGLAVLAMADKIEHPQFKQLVRNIEISTRYTADFSMLVNDSRKSMREYLRQNEERKGMLREAAINMALLLGMSVIVLLVVDRLIEVSIWVVLLQTFVGHIAIGIVGMILFLFALQVMALK